MFSVVKVCSSIPATFHGDWIVTSSAKTVEFRKDFYRAYGSHGNDPFCKLLSIIFDGRNPTVHDRSISQIHHAQPAARLHFIKAKFMIARLSDLDQCGFLTAK